MISAIQQTREHLFCSRHNAWSCPQEEEEDLAPLSEDLQCVWEKMVNKEGLLRDWWEGTFYLRGGAKRGWASGWSLQAMQCLPDRYRGQQEGWSGGGTVLAKVWQCGSLWELFVVFAAGGRSGCDGLRGQTGLETRGLWSRSPGIHTRSLGSHGPGILAA